MANRPPATRKRWLAALIIALFVVAVAAAAVTGWWFARESPPHQGPLVLVSVTGLRADRLAVYGGRETGAIDALAKDGIVFDHAYAHSPQTLPAETSLLTGLLPFEHGVRDDGGFALGEDTRTAAELLRNRGFATGAAVSTFLLRRATGVAQGFSFFDAELPAVSLRDGARPERRGAATLTAATTWIEQQRSQRYFLFVQADAGSVNDVVGGVVDTLKRTGRYESATIVFTADHGDGDPSRLDDSTLRVPLIVKQPEEIGAGRRVDAAVQHIDVLPTLLDVVRAPLPSGLRGRSLRPILDDDDGTVPARPQYAEWLARYFRLDGHPVFALSDGGLRVVTGHTSTVQQLALVDANASATVAEDLRAGLTALTGQRPIAPPTPPRADETDALAAFGYHYGLRPTPPLGQLDAETEQAIAGAYTEVPSLIARGQTVAAVDRLRGIVQSAPEATSILFQLGTLAASLGRTADATTALTQAAMLRPADAELPMALADVFLLANRAADATPFADSALMLATGDSTPGLVTRARAVAARVALALADFDGATMHAAGMGAANGGGAWASYVQGRAAYASDRNDDALAAFRQADMAVSTSGDPIPQLHLYLGLTLTRLAQYDEADTQFHAELEQFPGDLDAYEGLAAMYHAADRDADTAALVKELLEAHPTVMGYAVAVRIWTSVGERRTADGLRAEARRRFKGDPALPLLGRR